MIAFLVRRLLQAIAVMAVVALCAFCMFQYVGDPINQMVAEDATAEDREYLRESLGLNDPIPLQFAKFALNAAKGNYGISYQHKRPVAGLILERLPATLELALTAALIAALLGVPAGVYTGLRRFGFTSKMIMTLSLIGISLPTFLIGILLIYLFAVILGWLPSFGRGEVVNFGGWGSNFFSVNGLKSIILPAITLGLFQMTLIMRLIRSEMLEVLRTDFIKFARARGLHNRAINYGHALKNTLVPVITIIGLQLGSLIAFAVITETVFQWPGMGQLFLQAVQVVDIPIMSAYLILIALFFVVINLIVDILYSVLDPRLRGDQLTGGGHG